jgi:predicted DNA-binding transcriptional regulator YafY
MKSRRLMSALLLLQSQGRLSTRQIAERLEISQRTAHRDMESLCMAGVPLLVHRGAQGGWELQKGWQTKVPGLDAAELQSLLMIQPSALGDRRLSAAAQRAYDKLMASLPKAARSEAESIRARLHIDPTGWRLPAQDISMLPIVEDAVTRDCKLSFVYTRSDGDSGARTVDPLGLVCKQAVWYLVASTPKGMRTYRVSRMRDAVVLALAAKRPVKFDLAKYWKSSTDALREQKRQVSATLALSPKAVLTLTPWCAMQPVSGRSAGKSLPAEWGTFEVEFESHDQACFIVLGLGSSARAVAPRVLCQEVEAEISRAADLSHVIPYTGDTDRRGGDSPRSRGQLRGRRST